MRLKEFILSQCIVVDLWRVRPGEIDETQPTLGAEQTSFLFAHSLSSEADCYSFFFFRSSPGATQAIQTVERTTLCPNKYRVACEFFIILFYLPAGVTFFKHPLFL